MREKLRADYEQLIRIAVTVNMIATGTDITAPRGSALANRGAISQSPAESRDNSLEVLLFLRDVRSRVYFEQMKGRGTRVLTASEMQAVSGEDARTKDHFVIVDAVGVCDSDTAPRGSASSIATRILQSPRMRDNTESRPLERLPTVALEKMLKQVAFGDRSEDTLTAQISRSLDCGSAVIPSRSIRQRTYKTS